jgi:hypothetical protein
MNEHHFSYPVVVPLRGVTISGHSSDPPAPAGSLQAIRPLQPLVRQAFDAAPAPGRAVVALAS